MSSISSKVVAISMDDSPWVFKTLNILNNLSEIRKVLENNNINDMLLFSKKVNGEFYEIKREQENNFLLEEIITVDNDLNILYLKRFHWKFLNGKCKLDYGSAMSFDGISKAKKKAFIMKDCELKLIDTEGYRKGQLEFRSKEDWMKKTNLFFSPVNSVGLRTLMIKLKNKNFNDEIKLNYLYTVCSKVSLKLSKENLEPTDDFKKDVISAINSGDAREEFRKITEEYGQFISTEVILGGRVYSKEGNITSTSKFYNFDRIKLLGGKHSDETNFDEKAWIESLEDYQNWHCIEYKNPISIFQLLSDDLHKEVFESIGKRILYTITEDCVYFLNKPGMPRIYDLDNLPPNILKIIQNEDADCDYFASVVDTEDLKNVFFNCQVLRPTNGKPSIIIHCTQKKFRARKYKLKIGLMVTGYDIDFELILSDISVEVVKKNYDSQNPCEFFSIPLEQKWDLGLIKASGNPFFGISILSDLGSPNNSLIIGHNFRSTQSDTEEDKIDTFSYCLEKKCYVNLPKFTFCTFIIILNNPTSNAYALLPFTFSIFGNPFINLEGQSGNLNAFFGKPSRFRNWVIRKLYEGIFRKQIQSSNLNQKSKQSSSINPKYVSLYLSKDNYRPIFLKQKTKQIKLKYVDCRCKGTCSICSGKTKKISKNDNNSCILFDPSNSDKKWNQIFVDKGRACFFEHPMSFELDGIKIVNRLIVKWEKTNLVLMKD